MTPAQGPKQGNTWKISASVTLTNKKDLRELRTRSEFEMNVKDAAPSERGRSRWRIKVAPEIGHRRNMRIGHRRGLRCMQEKNYQKSCHKRSEKTSRKGYQYVGYNATVPKPIIIALKMKRKSLLDRCRTISTRMLRNWMQNGFARGPKYILKPCQNDGSTYKNYNGQCIDNWHKK